MKKTVALILSVLMILSAFFSMGISVFAETSEGYTVIMYKDSTKDEILLTGEDLKKGDIFSVTLEPTKDGYSFVSWVDDATGERVAFENDYIVVGESDAVYYAEWSINSYKLVYRDEDEIVGEFDVVYSTPASEMPVPEAVPGKDGYTFVEWKKLPETMPASQVNITPVWRDNDLNAYFYANYGDEAEFKKADYHYGDAIFEPDTVPEKTGYTFEGWSKDGSTVIGEAEFGTMGNEDVRFYAVWTANKYNATFNADGGQFADGSSEKLLPVDYNSQIVFDEIPVKDGYVFNGWSPAVGIMNSTDGLEFTANWVSADSIYYTVRYYTMGTDGEYGDAFIKYNFTKNVGETVTLEHNVGNGFKINEEKSTLSGVVAIDSSLVLEVYIDRVAYKLFLVIDNLKKTEPYLYGETIPAPATPEKEGYTFLKWEPAVPSTMPDEDYTVTAIWKKNDAPHVHSGKEVTVEPTCTADGKKYTVCTGCGETIGEETVIPSSGHNSTDWLIVLQPTETANGKKIKKCVACGITLAESVIPNLSGTDLNKRVKIINNPGTSTLNYGETLRVYVEVKDMPEGCKTEWTISGEGAKITRTLNNYCEIQATASGTVMLTVTVVGSDGEPVRDESGNKLSDSQYVNVKAGIIQKIIAFFRMLFGTDRIIAQAIKYI